MLPTNMKLSEFKNLLSLHPSSHLRFRLPDGSLTPAHAHVTEVARIDKRFIDCGGTLRNETYCRLQTWVADDLDHRLTAGKLLGILTKGAPILGTEDLEVDIEHETTLISQYPLATVTVQDDELVLGLETRHTACLAPELCVPSPAPATRISFKARPLSTHTS